MLSSGPEIGIVTRPTELAGLRERFVTDQQVKFYLQQAKVQDIVKRKAAHPSAARKRQQPETLEAADLAQAAAAFQEVEKRDDTYQETLERLQHDLEFDLPVRCLDRRYLPNFDFGRCALVVVVGQDGLVANTAKYVGDLPIVAVNPDPRTFDGVLLPFRVNQARAAVARVLDKKARLRKVTLAEVQLNDNQKMLAFNDFFVGYAGHASARYTLEFNGQTETQSSSGVLISTGAGSTGWFSSVVNMARGVGEWLGSAGPSGVQMSWEERRLAWAVREPFVSKQSKAGLVAGYLDEGQELILESSMASGGVIFSDGIESDFLQFNSGAIARISVAKQQANLVIG